MTEKKPIWNSFSPGVDNVRATKIKTRKMKKYFISLIKPLMEIGAKITAAAIVKQNKKAGKSRHGLW
jgi:TFIIF-interacting CTD phosphatase-like protein